MKTASSLTQRQARFVEEFLLDANGTQAAIRAGYGVASARVTAHRLLTNAAVSEAIGTRQHADRQRLGMAREDVLKGLLEAIDLAREQMNPAGMVAGLREIGKLMGFYAPQHVNVSVGAAPSDELRRMEAMSDSELEAFVATRGHQG
jgi:hypothetical protein